MTSISLSQIIGANYINLLFENFIHSKVDKIIIMSWEYILLTLFPHTPIMFIINWSIIHTLLKAIRSFTMTSLQALLFFGTPFYLISSIYKKTKTSSQEGQRFRHVSETHILIVVFLFLFFFPWSIKRFFFFFLLWEDRAFATYWRHFLTTLFFLCFITCIPDTYLKSFFLFFFLFFSYKYQTKLFYFSYQKSSKHLPRVRDTYPNRFFFFRY